MRICLVQLHHLADKKTLLHEMKWWLKSQWAWILRWALYYLGYWLSYCNKESTKLTDSINTPGQGSHRAIWESCHPQKMAPKAYLIFTVSNQWEVTMLNLTRVLWSQKTVKVKKYPCSFMIWEMSPFSKWHRKVLWTPSHLPIRPG